MAAAAAVAARIVIVGAGFSGIGIAVNLKKRGYDDFIILERSDSFGGVWHKNRYPGAACDVPAHLYSFSFEPRAAWRQKYASQAEILRYLVHCASKYGLEPHIRFGVEVTEALWDEPKHRWIVRTSGGHVIEARALITATGQLSRPSYPSLPGLERFASPLFHSAEWQDHDLDGKSVAVIGTGASAIQIVPMIAPRVNKLYVFQRSAAYVLPKSDTTYSARQIQLFKRFPLLLWLRRMTLYLQHEQRAFAFVTWRAALRIKRRSFFRHLRRGVKNVELRERLTPNYRMGCKRILLSDDFYSAMDRANVELVTAPIEQIRPNTIVATDAEREVDCIICATGFAASDFLVPMKVVGLHGQDLHQSWKTGAEAYLGMTVSGFPNFFMLYGPNTNLAHNSVIFMIESQIHYVLACLARLEGDGVQSIEVKNDSQQRYNRRIQQRLQNAIWAKGCTSWYLTAAGRNTTNWPGYSFGFWLLTRAPNWDDYVVQ